MKDAKQLKPYHFKKGSSGNPGGRPKGILSPRALLNSIVDVEKYTIIVSKVYELAKEGNLKAIEILMNKKFPNPLDDEPLTLKINGSKSERANIVMEYMSDGVISASQANAALTCIERAANISDIQEIKDRISKLEENRK